MYEFCHTVRKKDEKHKYTNELKNSSFCLLYECNGTKVKLNTNGIWSSERNRDIVREEVIFQTEFISVNAPCKNRIRQPVYM